jgi:hypothetical protein
MEEGKERGGEGREFILLPSTNLNLSLSKFKN